MNRLPAFLCCLLLGACTATLNAPIAEDQSPSQVPRELDMGLLWVKTAAEYDAVSRQAYQVATSHLPAFIADDTHNVVPQQKDFAGKPPAVILDVDTTVLNHINFQMSFERPFENWKLDEYDRLNTAQPVPGVIEFLNAAREQGVEIFLVTNRPCELRDGQSMIPVRNGKR